MACPWHIKICSKRAASAPRSDRRYKDYIPAEDNIVVERMKRAGAVTIGKTNVPELGSGSQTFNKIFGATRNPYDLTKTCGGSTGGGAVSLACGLAPVVSGTDTGGSLRNPAAFSNVVGFRPSVGRVPNPKASFAWSTLHTAGCLGRSVADLAFVLSTIAGPDARAPLSINEPGEIFARPLDRGFKGVRVAFFKNLGGVPFDPRVRTIVDGHRKTFESLGCIVEQAEPDFALAELAFRKLRAWDTAHTADADYRAHPEMFKDTLKGEIEEGLRLTGMDVANAEAAHAQLWRGFQAFLEKYEYFILPTTQLPPFDVNTEYPTEIAGVKFTNYIDWMKSCWYISATGNPAASVPGGFTPEGLPTGVQIVGRDKGDFSVLQMAHAFEQATGFGKKRPSVA
ncbi:MAG TPA: amidase family protein [Candidatus Acidoferrales bacterium]|nr:amidase family protein [Candidatus Acidoferrales bacterium]